MGQEGKTIHADSLVLRLVQECFGGSQAEAARHFKTSRQAIQHWVRRGFLPAHRVFDAQDAAVGQITAEQFMDEYIAKNEKVVL